MLQQRQRQQREGLRLSATCRQPCKSCNLILLPQPQRETQFVVGNQASRFRTSSRIEPHSTGIPGRFRMAALTEESLQQHDAELEDCPQVRSSYRFPGAAASRTRTQVGGVLQAETGSGRSTATGLSSGRGRPRRAAAKRAQELLAVSGSEQGSPTSEETDGELASEGLPAALINSPDHLYSNGPLGHAKAAEGSGRQGAGMATMRGHQHTRLAEGHVAERPCGMGLAGCAPSPFAPPPALHVMNCSGVHVHACRQGLPSAAQAQPR